MESLLTSGQNLKHISKLYIYISCSSLFILFSFWRFQITDILRNNYISFRYAQRYFLSLFLNSTPLLFISSLSVVHWGKDMCVNSKKKKEPITIPNNLCISLGKKENEREKKKNRYELIRVSHAA